ncbi:MAG TPA: hypothetical protein VFZ53_07650 [Polyangiaceae bacterium]
MKLRHFPALAGVFLVVGACNGMTSIGGEEGGAGGEAGDDESGGTAGRGGSSMRGGSGGTAGSAGTAGTGGTAGSMTNPCAGKPCGAECSTCSPTGEPEAPGGMGIPCDTAVRFCSAEGTCEVTFPVCENQCETSMDCPVLDVPCQMCADGTTQCPKSECLMGRCVSQYPTCQTECRSSSDCSMIGAPCQMCPDGTTSCPQAECVMGRCTTGWPGCGGNDPCADRACGDPCNPGCTEADCGMNGDVAFMCNADGRCVAEAPRCADECETARDCPEVDLCRMCPGGTCAPMECLSGRCELVCPPFDPPEPECMTARDCVVDDICRYCPDMSCAEVACISGECKSVCPL